MKIIGFLLDETALYHFKLAVSAVETYDINYPSSTLFRSTVTTSHLL